MMNLDSFLNAVIRSSNPPGFKRKLVRKQNLQVANEETRILTHFKLPCKAQRTHKKPLNVQEPNNSTANRIYLFHTGDRNQAKLGRKSGCGQYNMPQKVLTRIDIH